MNDDLKKDFIKEVHAAAKSRHAVDVFADMVRAMAISIEVATHVGPTDALEDEYAHIKGRYEPDEFEHFYHAFAIVMAALEKSREDFLGHALEELGASNTRNGQFLTPVCVSRLMAKVNCRELDYTPGHVIRLSDPSCGSSVMLIEGAEQLVADGVRQGDLLLIAGDVDHRACDISYIQLSLLGYAAVVQHADALAMKRLSPDRFTPGYFLHCMPMRGVLRHERQTEAAPKPTYQQPDLFGGVKT
jgi:hypothetical protein